MSNDDFLNSSTAAATSIAIWAARMPEQARAIVAAKIKRILDERKLSTRDAEKLTGVSHSEFTRIRNSQLRRFTLDRIITILGKFDEEIEVNLTLQRRKRMQTHEAPKVA